MKRIKYSDYYKKRTVLSGKGNAFKDEYIYTGDYFRFENDRKQVVRLKAKILAIAVVCFILYISGGFIDTGGSRVFYVLLPFVFAFLPLAFLLIAAFQFAVKHGDFTVFDYERIWLRLKRTGIASVCLLGISILGEIIFFSINFSHISVIKETGFMLCCSVIVFLDLMLIRIHAKTACIQKSNDVKKETG